MFYPLMLSTYYSIPGQSYLPCIGYTKPHIQSCYHFVIFFCNKNLMFRVGNSGQSPFASLRMTFGYQNADQLTYTPLVIYTTVRITKIIIF